MKKLLLCLVALFAAIGAQASTQTISKGEGTSGTSTVKFSATDKDDITAKAIYTLTLNADNKLKVELTFADLKKQRCRRPRKRTLLYVYRRNRRDFTQLCRR